MSEINAETVERRKRRLLDEYDDVAVVEEREEASAEVFPDLIEGSKSGYVGAGYAWIVRRAGDAAPLSESMGDVGSERDRVLMILGRGSDEWGLPGGGREAGESFEEAAIREVHEETGIDCAIEDCFLLRHRVTVADGFDERLHTLWCFFDGRYEGGSIAVQAGELNGAAWFAEPPGRMLPANERRAETWFDG